MAVITNRRPLEPNTRVRVMLDGVQFYARVEDLVGAPLRECVESFNRAAAGGGCLGIGSTYSGHQVQIDLVNPIRPKRKRAGSNVRKALADLVLRCDGEEGVREDGSNIDTLGAHAALGWLRGA